jgi:hypothetical protein
MTATEPAPLMFRISDVVRLTRLSRSVIYEQIRAGAAHRQAGQRHPHHRGRARRLRQAARAGSQGRTVNGPLGAPESTR